MHLDSLLNQDLNKEAATGGSDGLETQIGEILGAASLTMTAQGIELAIQAVETADQKSGRSVDKGLANLSQGAGQRWDGTAEYFVAIDAAGQISAGDAVADLAARVHAGTMTDTQAAAITAAEGASAQLNDSGVTTVGALISLEDALGGDKAVEMQIGQQMKGDLLDGPTQQALVADYGQGTLTENEVVNILTDAVALAEKKGSGVATLAGAAEDDVAIAELDDAMAFGSNLTQPYGEAIAAGEALEPIVNMLGPQLASEASQAGAQLSELANPTTAQQTKIVAQLENETTAAGASIDAALALASVSADGGSEVLNSVITNRLMDGAAQSSIRKLVNSGELDFTARASILDEEVAAHIGPLLNQDLQKEAATGGDDALETQIGKLLGADVSALTSQIESAIQTVEAAATKSGRSVDQALVNLSQGASVRFDSAADEFIVSQETSRIENGAAAAGLAAQVEAGTMTDTQAAAIMAAEGVAAQNSGSGVSAVSALVSLQDALGGPITGDAAVEMQIAQQPKFYLLDGGAEQELVVEYSKADVVGDEVINVGQGALTEDEVINLLSDAIGLAEKKGSGVASLSGVVEADVVIAKLDDVVQSNIPPGTEQQPPEYAESPFQVFANDLSQNYSAAITVGESMEPIVNALGPTLADDAYKAGVALFGIADPTTGQEVKIFAQLESDATAAGASIDAMLTVASISADGHNEVLKLAMTDRLMGGAAENDLANLVASGALTPQAAFTICSTEVGSLAAASANNSALGFDRATAEAYVVARLDLAANEIQTNQPNAGAAYNSSHCRC